MRSIIAIAGIAIIGLCGPIRAAEQPSPIKSDEEIVFYPTSGWLDAEGQCWNLPVHGSIFEPETHSLKRAILVRILKETLPGELSAAEAEIFDRRVRLFLVDDERGKKIAVRIGSRVFPAGESAASGQFETALNLSTKEVAELEACRIATDGWLSFEAVTQPGQRRRMEGRVQLVGPTGLSIISDIDDTIKVTQVRDRKAMLANTFLRPFQPVPGMPDLYRRLAEGGAIFHYVSASPWQLYPVLAEFLSDAQFPQGSFFLKTVRLTDPGGLDLLSPPEKFKRPIIEMLLARYPQRRFVLVGDTGEKDPEIFGRLAREHSEQIVGVFLRNVSKETAGNPRMAKALEGVPAGHWTLFDRPEQLREQVESLLRK